MAHYDKGSLILAEVEVKKAEPFGSDTLYDPTTSVTITIVDNLGATKIDTASMVKSTTGYYYYNIQTETNWESGVYTSIVIVTDSGDTDVTNKIAFALKT